MKGWNRISFVPDNSLLFALNGLQFIKPLEAGTTTLAEAYCSAARNARNVVVCVSWLPR
jgi:hypothetical protein